MRTSTRAAIVAGLLASVAALSGCGSSAPDVSEDPDQIDLAGRIFVADDVMVNDEPYRLVRGTVLRVSFEEGTVGASAGCNSMSGSAQWETGVLVVDGQTLSMTEMGCQAALMEQDTWFADFLTSEPRLLQSGTTLTMSNEDTVIVLTDEARAVPDAGLTGTMWRLDALATAGAVSSVPSGVESSLQFDDKGGLAAFLGCNSGRGTYSVRGDLMTIEALATTKKACSPPASDVESALSGFLEGDITYSIDRDTLILTAQTVVGPGPDALVYRAS